MFIFMILKIKIPPNLPPNENLLSSRHLNLGQHQINILVGILKKVGFRMPNFRIIKAALLRKNGITDFFTTMSTVSCGSKRSVAPFVKQSGLRSLCRSLLQSARVVPLRPIFISSTEPPGT